MNFGVNVQSTALLETIDQNLISKFCPAAKETGKQSLSWVTMWPAKFRVYIFEEEKEINIRGQFVVCHNRDINSKLYGSGDHNLSIIPHSAP